MNPSKRSIEDLSKEELALLYESRDWFSKLSRLAPNGRYSHKVAQILTNLQFNEQRLTYNREVFREDPIARVQSIISSAQEFWNREIQALSA